MFRLLNMLQEFVRVLVNTGPEACASALSGSGTLQHAPIRKFCNMALAFLGNWSSSCRTLIAITWLPRWFVVIYKSITMVVKLLIVTLETAGVIAVAPRVGGVSRGLAALLILRSTLRPLALITILRPSVSIVVWRCIVASRLVRGISSTRSRIAGCALKSRVSSEVLIPIIVAST